jgi:hypothetical protein
MSDADSSGFGKFVPGFDFLQNLAKGASANVPQMPNLGNWVAPTLNVEELDKRIEELKNVQFWLEQNSRALSATIQALEVQRMTLATLKGMNFNLGDVANAFKLQAADTVAQTVSKATETATETAKTVGDMAGGASKTASKTVGKVAATATGGMVDPLQLWGSLTQQFQNIAASALKEVTAKTAVDLSKSMAAGMAKGAAKAATGAVKKPAAKKSPARKTPARKSVGR